MLPQRLALGVEAHGLLQVGQGLLVATHQVQYPSVGVEAVGVVGLSLHGAAAHGLGLLQVDALLREVVGVVVQRRPVVGLRGDAAVEGPPGLVVLPRAVVGLGLQGVGGALEVSLAEAPLDGGLGLGQRLVVAAVHHGLHGQDVVRQGVHGEELRGAPCIAEGLAAVVTRGVEAHQQHLPHLVLAAVALQGQLHLVRRLGVAVLVEEHIAVEGGKLRAVGAVGHGHVHQAERRGAAAAEELLGAVERPQELQLALAVEGGVGEGAHHLAVGLGGLPHGFVVFGQLYVYVRVLGVGRQDAVVVGLGLRIALLLHVHLGQDGVALLVARHGFGQGLDLGHGLVGLAGGVPQLGFLHRDGLGDADALLHAVQHLHGLRQVAGGDVAVRQLVIVVQHLGVLAHNGLPCRHGALVVVLHLLRHGQREEVPHIVALQGHGAARAGLGAVAPSALRQQLRHAVPCGVAARKTLHHFAVGRQGLVLAPRFLQRQGVDEHPVLLQLRLRHLADGLPLVGVGLRGGRRTAAPAARGQHHRRQHHRRHSFFIHILFFIYNFPPIETSTVRFYCTPPANKSLPPATTAATRQIPPPP